MMYVYDYPGKPVYLFDTIDQATDYANDKFDYMPEEDRRELVHEYVKPAIHLTYRKEVSDAD